MRVTKVPARSTLPGRYTKAAESGLTFFDPIKDTVGFRGQSTHRASSSNNGTLARTSGEAGIALPRRSYTPTV